jgi:hypothetical protein
MAWSSVWKAARPTAPAAAASQVEGVPPARARKTRRLRVAAAVSWCGSRCVAMSMKPRAIRNMVQVV